MSLAEAIEPVLAAFPGAEIVQANIHRIVGGEVVQVCLLRYGADEIEVDETGDVRLRPRNQGVA